MSTILNRPLRLVNMFVVGLCLVVPMATAESPPVVPVPAKPAAEPASGPKIHQTHQFVSRKDAAANHVVKALADLGDVGMDPSTAAKLKLDKVDFTKQMIVVIESGMTNSFGVQLSALGVEKVDGGAEINWQYKPYFGGAAPPDQPGNPTLVVVLDRVEGEVKFKRTNWKWPEGLPLPPSAPPGGGPGGGIPRLR